MADHKMRVGHDPDNDQYGDCFRCSLAFAMGLVPEDVPHFMQDGPNREAEQVWRDVDAWLKPQGLVMTHIPFNGTPDQVMNIMAGVNDGPFYYLMGGKGPRGEAHSVVACLGRMVMDPHPDGDGLVAPCDDGYTWVNIIIPRAVSEET